MRVKLTNSKEVYDGSAEEILRRIHRESAPVRHQSFTAYMDGVRERLRDFKKYLNPPEAVRARESAYAEWLAAELLRIGRWQETTEPTTDEQKAEAERKKAEAAAAAKAAPAAKAPAAPAAKAAPAAAPADGNAAPAAKPAAATDTKP